MSLKLLVPAISQQVYYKPPLPIPKPKSPVSLKCCFWPTEMFTLLNVAVWALLKYFISHCNVFDTLQGNVTHSRELSSMNSQLHLDFKFQSRHFHRVSESMRNDPQMTKMYPVTYRLSSPGLGPGPVRARPGNTQSPTHEWASSANRPQLSCLCTSRWSRLKSPQRTQLQHPHSRNTEFVSTLLKSAPKAHSPYPLAQPWLDFVRLSKPKMDSHLILSPLGPLRTDPQSTELESTTPSIGPDTRPSLRPTLYSSWPGPSWCLPLEALIPMKMSTPNYIVYVCVCACVCV